MRMTRVWGPQRRPSACHSCPQSLRRRRLLSFLIDSSVRKHFCSTRRSNLRLPVNNPLGQSNICLSGQPSIGIGIKSIGVKIKLSHWFKLVPVGRRGAQRGELQPSLPSSGGSGRLWCGWLAGWLCVCVRERVQPD